MRKILRDGRPLAQAIPGTTASDCGEGEPPTLFSTRLCLRAQVHDVLGLRVVIMPQTGAGAAAGTSAAPRSLSATEAAAACYRAQVRSRPSRP